MIDINEIMTLMRTYPFLLVDRVVEFEPAKHAVGIKNVTFNEPFFTGHFQACLLCRCLIIEA